MARKQKKTSQRASSRRHTGQQQQGKEEQSHGVTPDEEQIALEFETEEGLEYCVRLLVEERPEVPFDLPGRRSVIIPKRQLRWFTEKIRVRQYVFTEVPVVAASAVSPDRRAALRAQYGTPAEPEYGDLSWKKDRIVALRKKLDL